MADKTFKDSLSFLNSLKGLDSHKKAPKQEDILDNIPKNFSDSQNLEFITQVFQQIEEESVQIAEMLFEHLIDVDDKHIMTGDIPTHKNKKINAYINILNRLFRFSRASNIHVQGSFRIISRKMIKELDKKTYAISMCHDGGTSLDILCDVVNSENSARTPNNRVKIKIVKQFAPEASKNYGKEL